MNSKYLRIMDKVAVVKLSGSPELALGLVEDVEFLLDEVDRMVLMLKSNRDNFELLNAELAEVHRNILLLSERYKK